jgi:hypothetical protein
MVKRMLYGPLPKLGEVHDGMDDGAQLVPLELDGSPVTGFKNLYAIGIVR